MSLKFQHLTSQQSKNRFPSASSLRVPEVGRHCISRHRNAMTPPWSGSWLPVPTSMLWTLMVVASELEEWTRIFAEICRNLASEHHISGVIEIVVGKRKVIRICKAARTFPSPTSDTLPRSKAKNVFLARLPFECPRFDAIAYCGEKWP